MKIYFVFYLTSVLEMKNTHKYVWIDNVKYVGDIMGV